jgi:hypothetical protein
VEPDIFIESDAFVESDAIIEPDQGQQMYLHFVNRQLFTINIPLRYFPDAGQTKTDAEPCDCPPGTYPKKEKSDEYLIVGGGGCNIGKGNITGWGIMGFIGVALLFGFVFGGRKALLVLLIVIGLSGSSYATPPIPDLKLAPSINDFFTTMSPKTLGHLNFNVKLDIYYSNEPLRLVDATTKETAKVLVDYRMNADLAFAMGFKNRFELGFVLPALVSQDLKSGKELGVILSPYSFGLADFGDMRVIPKIYVASDSIDEITDMYISLAAPITLPTGDRRKLFGDNGIAIQPTILAGITNRYFTFAGNFGVHIRSNQDEYYELQRLHYGDELSFGFGLSIHAVKNFGLLEGLDLIGDFWGDVGLDDPQTKEANLEVMGGLRAFFKEGFVATFGVGGGITRGYGIPEYRVLGGIAWKFDWKEKKCKLCVDKKIVREKVVVRKVRVVERMVIIPPVYFDTDKATLRADSIIILDSVVKLLKAYPSIRKLRLEGHCDYRASNRYNMALSERRANAARDYLSDKGISLKRLVPRYYGETQKVDNSKTKKGMQKNRRVEFHIEEVK